MGSRAGRAPGARVCVEVGPVALSWTGCLRPPGEVPPFLAESPHQVPGEEGTSRRCEGLPPAVPTEPAAGGSELQAAF